LSEKRWKLICESYEVDEDGYAMHSRLCSRAFTVEELEQKKVDDAEWTQRMQIYKFNRDQCQKWMPKTIDEKMAFLRQKSAKYDHEYPSMDIDFPHACKECYCYRMILHFGYIELKNGTHSNLNFSDKIKIVGNIQHICDFNGPVEIGVRRKVCSYYRLRKIDDFERYLFQLLDWSRAKMR